MVVIYNQEMQQSTFERRIDMSKEEKAARIIGEYDGKKQC